jgi:hypothetical protein
VDGGKDQFRTLTWSKEMPITFGPAASTLAVTGSIDLPPGSYYSADVIYHSKYDAKMFCNTSSVFMYTTPGGVVTLPHNVSSRLTYMPSDYGFLHYDLVEMTKRLGLVYHGKNAPGISLSKLDLSFAVLPNEPAHVSLLFDTHNTGRCYDGTGSTEAYPTTNIPKSGIWPFVFDLSNR